MPQELAPEQLRWTCDPETLGFKTTEDVPPLEGLTGQDRAVQALEFGLGMRHKGFNIYVAGQPGTGKMTAVQGFLSELAKGKPTPPDYCYVNNFEDPYRPRALKLPAGRGRDLRAEMAILVERVQAELPRAFESEQYAARRDEIYRDVQRQREEFLSQLNQEAQEEGFSIQASPAGIAIVPLREGQPVTEQQFLQLDQATREDLRHKREGLEAKLKDSMKQLQVLERAAVERTEQLNREVALFIVGSKIEDLEEKYANLPAVVEYLRAVQEDMATHLQQFFASSSQEQQQYPNGLSPQERAFRKYHVNLLVDNSNVEGLPVIMERNPTYNNLFGRMEKESLLGAMYTDFTLIRPGVLHRANGGYLVIPVEDMLRSIFSYESMKHALRAQEIVIEEMAERMGSGTMKSLQPQPIPLDIKVVIVGGSMLYHLLYQSDEDFQELFKIKADFTTQMDRNDQTISDYVGFVCALAHKEGIRPMDCPAVARVIEEGARLADDQHKLSTRFSELADIIREADHRAGLANAEYITAEHIRAAIRGRIYRSNLVEERLQEVMRQGTILVDTEGEDVGQVNGLAVLSLGDYAFGKPSRITASVGLGLQGLVDIERESRLGGPIHTKGVLILSGYLNQHYSQDKPLSLNARLVFEQSYEGIEGDSASSTELYCLLSALSGVPIKQSLAVTGSVNQHGEVQAIGGVNQKIEGFFDLCAARGLTGEQGVLVPASNVRNLMLREDVVEAVKDEKFHVYPVHAIDEGIEILTGVPAGERGDDGRYQEGTINRLVDDRLREMAERLRSFGRDRDEERAREGRAREVEEEGREKTDGDGPTTK